MKRRRLAAFNLEEGKRPHELVIRRLSLFLFGAPWGVVPFSPLQLTKLSGQSPFSLPVVMANPQADGTHPSCHAVFLRISKSCFGV